MAEPGRGLKAGGRDARFRRVVVVRNGPNPSFDYYLAPRLGAAGLDVVTAELRRPWAPEDSVLEDALVLFCRYVTPGWLGRLERRPPAACALFLDDDLEALVADELAPAAYRRRVWRRGPAQWPRLGRRLDRLFVSTPTLARRFPGCAPVVLPPLAGPDDLAAHVGRAPGTPRFGFHATSVHVAEHRWLAPVVADLLDAAPEVQVEVVAQGATARLWRRHPRLHLTPQRSWPDYRVQVSPCVLDLLLAPLLPGPANQARAPVKRIDACRAGAGLVVSDGDLYGVTGTEQALGMHLPLIPQAWVEGLAGLARSPERLSRLAVLNREGLMAARSRMAPLVEPAGEPGWWRLSGATASPLQHEPGPA